MKKLFFLIIILLLACQTLFAEDDKQKLSFYGFADIQGVRESHRHTDNSSYISLSEVLLGMKYNPAKLIEVYIEAALLKTAFLLQPGLYMVKLLSQKNFLSMLKWVNGN